MLMHRMPFHRNLGVVSLIGEKLMDKVTVQLILAGLATVYAGLLLFIADVLNVAFKDMEVIAFRDFMGRLYRRASRSTVIILGGAVPFFGMFAYIFLYGFRDHLFLLGILVFNLSIVASSLVNAPLYKRIQALGPEDGQQLAAARSALCRANWIRAAIATIGMIMMLAACSARVFLA